MHNRKGDNNMVDLKKTEEQLTDEVMGKINLSKDKEVLRDNVVNLSKTVINLSKKAGVDIGSTKAQVVFVMDNSGSMDDLYHFGAVQDVVNKILPLGLTFDDNGEVEVFTFNSEFKQRTSLNINNYENYVREYLSCGGGTRYSGVLKEIKRVYIDGYRKGIFKLFGKGKKEVLSDTVPVFVVFITDGDNDPYDEGRTKEIIKELASTNTFIQFIGIGTADFNFLKELDNFKDRECDNTGFTKFDDISKVDSYTLYNAVLEQYADWLKVKGF